MTTRDFCDELMEVCERVAFLAEQAETLGLKGYISIVAFSRSESSTGRPFVDATVSDDMRSFRHVTSFDEGATFSGVEGMLR